MPAPCTSFGWVTLRASGEFQQQGVQSRIGNCPGGRTDAVGARGRGRGTHLGVPGFLEWQHPGRDGCHGEAHGAGRGKGLGLFHACARDPGGRFDQQQQTVVVQPRKGDVVAQRCGQRLDDAPAQLVGVATPGGQFGYRAALRDRRWAVGVAGRQRSDRRHDECI